MQSSGILGQYYALSLEPTDVPYVPSVKKVLQKKSGILKKSADSPQPKNTKTTHFVGTQISQSHLPYQLDPMNSSYLKEPKNNPTISQTLAKTYMKYPNPSSNFRNKQLIYEQYNRNQALSENYRNTVGTNHYGQSNPTYNNYRKNEAPSDNYRKGQAEPDSYGKNQAASDSYGKNLVASDSYGKSLAASDSYGKNLAVLDSHINPQKKLDLKRNDYLRSIDPEKYNSQTFSYSQKQTTENLLKDKKEPIHEKSEQEYKDKEKPSFHSDYELEIEKLKQELFKKQKELFDLKESMKDSLEENPNFESERKPISSNLPDLKGNEYIIRMEDLRRQREEEMKLHAEKIRKAKMYKEDLDLQTSYKHKINSGISHEEAGKFYDSEQVPLNNSRFTRKQPRTICFNPITGELKDASLIHYQIPKINEKPHHFNPHELANFPAFQQPKYTKKHPKNHLTFAADPGSHIMQTQEFKQSTELFYD